MPANLAEIIKICLDKKACELDKLQPAKLVER